MNSPKPTLEDIEVQLLLEKIYSYWGYDFRNYAFSSLKRRIQSCIYSEGLFNISQLQEKILDDKACLDRFVLNITVNVTSMFRDPSFYIAFRNEVIPLLRTYPFIRIWHAGCSTGEEVYSMAILLQEEGLYQRCRIYATDLNEKVLQKAKSGIFSLNLIQNHTELYIQSGGKKPFSEYYTAADENAIFRASLRENIIFAQHNLVIDSSFNEFNVILCRNVLIYFNKNLQNHVHKLFYHSLSSFGIIGLGKQESIRFTPYEHKYQELVNSQKLYRRVN
jgi:chemotaxis protein methyltransferase CheR